MGTGIIADNSRNDVPENLTARKIGGDPNPTLFERSHPATTVGIGRSTAADINRGNFADFGKVHILTRASVFRQRRTRIISKLVIQVPNKNEGLKFNLHFPILLPTAFYNKIFKQWSKLVAVAEEFSTAQIWHIRVRQRPAGISRLKLDPG